MRSITIGACLAAGSLTLTPPRTAAVAEERPPGAPKCKGLSP
jgi:hypothetical protein